MIISSDDIGERLKETFPRLKDWEPGDREFVTTEYDELKEIIEKHSCALFIRGVWECEEIANALIVDDRRNQAKNLYVLPDELQSRNRAIGRADGHKFHHVDEPHVVNIAIGKEDIWLFDMQTKEIWIPTEKDEVFWVVMI